MAFFFSQSDDDSLNRVFEDICSRGDGMTYDPESVAIEPIQIDNEYGGICVTLNAFPGNARLPLQFDVGSQKVIALKKAGPGFAGRLR